MNKKIAFIFLVGLMVNACSPFKALEDGFRSSLVGDIYGAKSALNQIEIPPDKNKEEVYFEFHFIKEAVESFIEGEENYPCSAKSDSLKKGLKKVEELQILFRSKSIDQVKFEKKYNFNHTYLDSLTSFFKDKLIECASIEEQDRQDSITMAQDSIDKVMINKQATILNVFINSVSDVNSSQSFSKGIIDSTKILAETQIDGNDLILRAMVWFRNKPFGKGNYKESYVDSLFFKAFDSLRYVIKDYAYDIHFYGVADYYSPGKRKV